MEAFFVVVLAATVLGVGVIAWLGLRRMRNRIDPSDTKEH